MQACHTGTWQASPAGKPPVRSARGWQRRGRYGTGIMQQIWHKGLAQGLAQNANPFDEAIEKKWIDTWLSYANSVRFAPAMAGGGD